MKELAPTFHRSRLRLWHSALAVSLVWSAIIAASLGWSIFKERADTLDNARHEAQLSFQKELLFRFWMAGHSGSPPANTNAPPSSDQMRIEERTLANLAPMLRQMQGQAMRRPDPAGMRSNLASLKPLRPENTPDAWEAVALRAFAKGETEVASVATLDGQEYMRVMRPLVNEASCVSCHRTQDFKVGDIRGGLSVSVPLAPLRAAARNELAPLAITDGLIWVLGLGVIGFVTRRMQAHNWERAMAEMVLRDSETRHRAVVDSANDAFVTINTSGVITGWDGAAEKIFHYTPAEMLGQPLVRILPPAGHDHFLADFKRIQAGGSPLRLGQAVEIAGQRRDGSVFPMELTVAEWQVSAERFFTGTMRDITERKRAEAALQLSQQRLSLHVEQTPLAVIEFDLTGRVRQWNPAAAATFGFSREEAIGQYWTFIVPTAIHGQLEGVWATIVGQRGGSRSTNENITKDGRTINCEWFNTPLIDPDGRTIGVASLIQDVSERQQAESALRLAHERLRRIVDANMVGILVANAAGAVIEANDYYLRLVGYTRAELEQGKVDWRTVTPPEWLPVDAQANRELEERGSAKPYEKEYLRRDGTRVPVLLADTMLPGPENQIAAFALDLTELKQAEGALRESEERYRMLFEHNPLPMWLRDVESLRFLAVNESAVQHYGYTREEFLGMTAQQLCNPEDVPALLKRIEQDRTESVSVGELRHRRKDGTILHVETFSRALTFAGRPARLVLANDVTEKKLIESKFLHAQRLESIGMLASGIAHDLNNVLAPIVFVAPLLRGSLSAPRDVKILDTLERSAARGTGLVQQILGFVHSSAGEFRPTQVKHLTRDIIGVIEETFPKSIQLEHHVPSDLWLVQGNPTQIHQVLLNLCVNARDAMPMGGTLRLTAANRRLAAAECAAIAGARPGDWLMLEVADTGTGIPPEVLARIWEPFFTTKSAGKGTGLGLSTVRGIVASHHGFVELLTEVGHGTTFRVYLPTVASESSQPGSATPIAIPDGHGELILVVDDEAPIRDLAAHILGQHGYRVVSCSDGVEALAVFNARASEISVLITDVDMPRLGGIALARAALQIRPDLRLIAMSGLSRNDTGGTEVPEIRQLAHAFLGKPFTAEELLGAIHQLLHPTPKS